MPATTTQLPNKLSFKINKRNSEGYWRYAPSSTWTLPIITASVNFSPSPVPYHHCSGKTCGMAEAGCPLSLELGDLGLSPRSCNLSWVWEIYVPEPLWGISVPHLIKELSYLPLRLRYYINSSNSICISKSSGPDNRQHLSYTHTHKGKF